MGSRGTRPDELYQISATLNEFELYLMACNVATEKSIVQNLMAPVTLLFIQTRFRTYVLLHKRKSQKSYALTANSSNPRLGTTMVHSALVLIRQWSFRFRRICRRGLVGHGEG